ncbi:hypothetical protein SMCF_7474 [Streptomyces coelicoflavus ZG0656]|nr:hypothetical protein SMCF_7474 [Streptomyces coelicoflavus ZG0656]
MTEVTGRVAAPVTQRQAYRVRPAPVAAVAARRLQAGSGAEAAEASAWAANLAFASSIFRP